MEVSRGRLDSDRYTNHQHSVSSDTISHAASSLSEFHSSRNTSPMQNINLRLSASSSKEGVRSRLTASWLPGSNKRHFTIRETASSQMLGSLSPESLSGQQEATSRPSTPLSHTLSDQGSHASKSVYPLVFYNPMSDCENLDVSSLDRMTAEEDQNSSSHWPDDASTIDHKLQKNLTGLQMETSADPSATFRREGLRWSSASSNDLGLDGEKYTIAGTDTDSQMATKAPASHKKCGVCGKSLWQKSPWSTRRIMKGDLPIAGVLACSHVFHAECLEQMTPTNKIHEPPCPVCLNMIGAFKDPSPVTLQTALRSLRGSRGAPVLEEQGNYSDNMTSSCSEDKSRNNWPWALSRGKTRGSRKRQSEKQSTFKGNVSKVFFGSKVHRQRDLSSSNNRQPF